MEQIMTERTVRNWGHYDVLADYGTCKLKELVVEPGCSLSYQRHRHRAELWFVRSGNGRLILNEADDMILNDEVKLTPDKSVTIPPYTWHQLINDSEQPLKIIEIQYGENCIEEDIERLNV